MKLPFIIGNKLYQNSFGLYKPVYYLYKRYTDQNKIKLLRSHTKQGMKIVDIGANIGFYTELFSQMTGPSGQVWAFEPDKKNYHHLQKLTQNNIIVENKAVGNLNQLIRLYISDDMNVDHRTYDDGSGREFYEVESIRLDDYLNDQDQIDVIKIDIQGYDYCAMMGMQKTIKNSANLLLITEFWPHGLKKAGVEPCDFLELIQASGLKYHTLSNEVIQPDNLNFEYYCDLICTK